MTGWFPRLRADGVIASGNSGIWLSPLDGAPVEVSPVGTTPVWAGQSLVFNRNDNTTHVGGFDPSSPWAAPLPMAYNEYVGSDCGQWAGFRSSGHVDRYLGPKLQTAIPGACAPRFYGASFGYLMPYQPGPSNRRALIVDGFAHATDVILDWVANRDGNGYVYLVATGTYTKQIHDDKGNDVTIRPQQDESPLVLFTGPDDYPWMLSVTPNSGTFVRMLYAAFGYVIAGDLYYPDARVIGSKLRVVGSLSNGQPRHIWMDFSAPKVDLRGL